MISIISKEMIQKRLSEASSTLSGFEEILKAFNILMRELLCVHLNSHIEIGHETRIN